MVSRRKFLEVGGVTAGLALTSRRAAGGPANDASLPPSLARLKSRKNEATPITRDEREQRQEHARQLMAENGLDAIVLMTGTSMQYFAGIRWWGGERTFALIMPAKGNSFYVCPAFEEGRAREQIANAPGGANPDVRVWQEDESPYERIAQGLKDRGIGSGKVGIEETIRFVSPDGIAKACPQATVLSATPVTAGCRMIKSSHEIALMRLASAGHAGGVRSCVSRREGWDDSASSGGTCTQSPRATRFHRRRRCSGGRVLGISAWLAHAAGRA